MKWGNKSAQCFMKELDDGINVFKLNLVGAHDCVTKYIQFPHSARCQSMSVLEQLNSGIRGLDIRVQSSGNKLVMVHGRAKAFKNALRTGGQLELCDVLDECYRFLEKHPSECIIFQFKNDDLREMEKCFDNLYDTYIKKNPDMWFLENRPPLLGEARGKIILLRRCKMEPREIYTDKNTGIDFSRWVEQDDAVNKPLPLDTLGEENMHFIIQDRYSYKPEPRWNEVIKPFLDSCDEFDLTYKINYISTAGGAQGPYKNARYVNSRFMQYELKNGAYYGMIYCDFPTQELIDKIILTNF